MQSAIAALERPGDQRRSEPQAAAPLPAGAAPPQRRPVLGRLPLLLMVLALAVLASQVSLSFSVTSGTPLFIAGGILGVAILALLAPALKSLAMAVAVPELKVLPLGLVAYALAQAGVPRDVLVMVLQAAVIGVSLIVPGGALVPSLAAALAALGYARALPSGAPDTLYVAAGLATTGLLMTLATGRLRRIEAQATREARRLGDEAARAVAESEATRQATEVAGAVLDVATGISAATEPSAIAEQIASGTASQVRAVGVVLLLWDDASETYRVGAIHGPHALRGSALRQVEVRPDTLPTLGPSTSGEIVQFGPGSVREPMLRGLLQHWKVTSMLGVRLQRGDELRGLLIAARSDRHGQFDVRDARILAGIAVHAGAALDHANLVADLQSANQLKEEFMATMSHELRTPLNVIIGYTDLQLEGAFGDLPEDHRETLGTVRAQALQLLELIQATLDMSRLERGLMTVDLRDISVAQVVEQLKVQIPAAWRKGAVELNWRVEPGLPPLRTDASKLQILLRNLIHNAMKFTHQGMVMITVSARQDREQLTFVVQDSGIGIRAEHLSEIFEMFRQAPDGERAPGGVGLGLYIVKRLATVLGAEIEVSSAPGRGATFRIHVPIAGPFAARA